jgi:ABC-2 type transport system ATP-binding protein
MNSSEKSVEVENLTVQFGDFKAVNDISFSVSKGEIFGFLGANGAGKTTTIRVLCGLLVPTQGHVSVAGVGQEEGLEAIKAKVGYMSQKFTLYNDLTIRENLEFTASLRKLDQGYFRRRTKDLLEFIAMTKPIDTLVRDLPGGIKQQVSLVASILHDPEIVFLDEPTAGVTPAARARFWELIGQLAAAGKTVFVTTHYMDEAEQCERIALMRGGQIIALDTPNGLKKKSFPEPLLEIEVSPGATGWVSKLISTLKANPGVADISPYGMRYHVSILDMKAWEDISADRPNGVTIRDIEPSLEDVFIRLVEGVNR